MNDQDFRRALLRLGLHSRSQAVRALGISRSSVIRYSRPGGESPLVVDRVIELLGQLEEKQRPKKR
jgi:DNA invertase Pin-like site-specific DNA recombinase